MDRQQALEKIRKCLALAESANEHEAAAAMRHARKLMDKFNLDLDENFFELKEQLLDTEFSRAPAWFQSLGATIGSAFGCSFYVGRNKAYFVGPGVSSDTAGYCLNVVNRLLHQKRKEFMKIPKVKYSSSADKRMMSTAFCEGFVIGVHDAIKDFAEPYSDEISEQHAKYMETAMNKNVYDSKAKSSLEKNGLNSKTAFAARNGINNGKEVEIHQGVGKDHRDQITYQEQS